MYEPDQVQGFRENTQSGVIHPPQFGNLDAMIAKLKLIIGQIEAWFIVEHSFVNVQGKAM
jgi:hypothetical protein